MEYGPDDQVERDAPTPPFQQLSGILRARVLRGDWAPNRAIASENTLADEYGLSRPTVRRAIAQLTTDGLLYAVPGRGTYVRDRSEEAPSGEPS